MVRVTTPLHFFLLLVIYGEQILEAELNGSNNGKFASNAPLPPVDEECGRYERCFQCIQSPGCMWCKDKSLSLESRRCFSNSSSKPIECQSFENPRGTWKVDRRGENGDNENGRIEPRLVELRLRKHEKINISLTYTDEKNRPLDLYIVMDLSCTMKKHKEKVANLTLTLAENLRNLTSNLRIGFGSFVDKPLAPFGYLAPPLLPQKKDKREQCEGEDIDFLPYGFKNHLRMTDNIEQFITKVKAAGISSNVDVPEGTLDGLLQSIPKLPFAIIA